MNLATLSSMEDIRTVLLGAIEMGTAEQVEPPLEHYHTAKQYARRIYVEAGTRILTKIHKTEHFTVALKGTCTVYDEDGNKTIVTAPQVFITKPGTRRAILAHDDVEWVTIHVCDSQDIEEIEKQLVCTSHAELDREDYQRVLEETNITEKWARHISENPRTWNGDLVPVTEYKIGTSEREGEGVIALRGFEVGERIGLVRVNTVRTAMGRFTNHSVTPNCEFYIEGSNIAARAIRPIKPEQEITVCYRLARKINLEASRFLEK